jgi:hypothetical protein
MKSIKMVIVLAIYLILAVSMAVSRPCRADAIVFDHTAVDLFDEIPDQYVQIIKTRLFNPLGESHNTAYPLGMAYLASIPGYAHFAVQTTYESEMFPPSDQYLRVTPARRKRHNNGYQRNTGEAEFFTTPEAVEMTKTHLTYQESIGNPVHYSGFGWCYDMTKENDPGGMVDPEYGVRWAGRSYNLDNDGLGRWGLDQADSDMLGNPVNMDMYLAAIEEYIQHAPDTKVFFSTGPVDDSATNTGENGYQRFLKNEYIREYVNSYAYSPEDRYLFDYADILTHGNIGDQNTVEWNSHVYPFIHDDNLQGGSTIAHIGMDGCVKIAKAAWVMLAIFEGWDPTGGETVSAEFQCTPSWGTLPFSLQLDIVFNNLVDDSRSFSGRIGLTLASGAFFANYRNGYTNLTPLEHLEYRWFQNLPNLAHLVGENDFLLTVMDVTASPYNQLPFFPSGDTATASCTVTGVAP